ncbi:MAG: helix-turn-helix domain-containing protein [Saprospiraceae bacterium]
MAEYKIVFRILLVAYIFTLVYFGLRDYDELQSENDMNESNKFELDDAVIQKIQKAFQTEVIENKIYLNKDISLQLLAQTLNTNTKYLSKFINREYNMSFIHLINSLRVEEAKTILMDPTNKKYTIESIGAMSGFNSKSSFNATFKKIVSMTPSEYRES